MPMKLQQQHPPSRPPGQGARRVSPGQPHCLPQPRVPLPAPPSRRGTATRHGTSYPGSQSRRQAPRDRPGCDAVV